MVYFIKHGGIINIILIRLLWIPMFIKNYCIPILEPNIYNYYLATTIVENMTSFINIYLGH